MHSKTINFLADLTATFFFSGKIKYAPGTCGSFCTLPLVMLVYPLGGTGIFLATLISYLLGLLALKNVLKRSPSSDPGFVVIDETAGQLITFLFIAPFFAFSFLNLILGFALFRFFDIVKIWPCSYFDKKIHNSFGVMTDDIFAGLYASFSLFLINHFLI